MVESLRSNVWGLECRVEDMREMLMRLSQTSPSENTTPCRMTGPHVLWSPVLLSKPYSHTMSMCVSSARAEPFRQSPRLQGIRSPGCPGNEQTQLLTRDVLAGKVSSDHL